MIKSILGGKSKNLCDLAYLLTLPVDKKFEGYGFWEVEISVEPNTAYTFSRENANQIDVGDATYFGITNQYGIPNGGSPNQWLNHEALPHLCHQNVQIISSSEGKLWVFFSSPIYKLWQKNLNPFGYIQLEKGSTATEYVPHEPTSYKSIMKVSDVCQLLDKSTYDPTHTYAGITWTNNGDGTITANGNVVSSTPYSPYIIYIPQFREVKNNHKYALFSGINNINVAYVQCIFWIGGSDSYFYQDCVETNIAGTFGFTIPQGEYLLYQKIELRVHQGYTANNLVFKPQLFDLTEMFGAGNEPKTVAEFKAKFPNDYYPYSPSCFVTSFDERMPCKTKNLLNITPSMCNCCTYKDGILKANVVDFYYAWLRVTDLFEIGNTYTVSWSIIHKKSLRQTAAVVVYGKSKTDSDKTVFREYRSGITDNKYTFTINDEDFSSISFVELRFFRYGTTTTDTESSILNVQVELGTTATDYVPYGYV